MGLGGWHRHGSKPPYVMFLLYYPFLPLRQNAFNCLLNSGVIFLLPFFSFFLFVIFAFAVDVLLFFLIHVRSGTKAMDNTIKYNTKHYRVER